MYLRHASPPLSALRLLMRVFFSPVLKNPQRTEAAQYLDDLHQLLAQQDAESPSAARASSASPSASSSSSSDTAPTADVSLLAPTDSGTC
jgi:hypothetical protein